METIFTPTTARDYEAFAGLVREYVHWCRARYSHDKWFVDAAFSHQSVPVIQGRQLFDPTASNAPLTILAGRQHMSRYMTAGFALLVSLIVGVHNATAEDACDTDSGPTACKGLGSDAGDTDCMFMLAKEQDQTLNKLYEQILPKMMEIDEPATDGTVAIRPGETFKQAQEAWVKFRDLQCSAERQTAGGGSGGSYVEATCLCNVTLNRNRDFQRMIRDAVVE